MFFYENNIYFAYIDLYLMKIIKILLISFENPVLKSELHAFRGGIVEKAGRQHILFHNHLNDTKYLYRYPKIQYKIINKHPSIVCINEGIDEIHKFFIQKDWNFYLHDRLYEVKVKKLLVNKFNMQVWNSEFEYNIYQWHPLNQKNNKTYLYLTSFEEKAEFLKNILIGNILSLAKGIDWHVDKELKVSILKINKEQWLPYKNTKLLTLDVSFKTNVFLPNYVGLGKHVSLGYGIVKQIKQKDNGKS